MHLTLTTRHFAMGVLILFACAGLTRAQNSLANYTFILASGFLCDPGDSSACPATAKATQGDSYELSGAGMFGGQDKSVKAAGTFAHKSANGTVLESGAWTASELVSFLSYGIAPNALRHEKKASVPPQIANKRLAMLSGPMPTGGLAVFRIVLQPISGAIKTAVLQVNCALGDVPRERSVEGIRLVFEKGGNEFSEEVGGRVLFLSMQLKVSPPANAAQQETAPGLAEPPHN